MPARGPDRPILPPPSRGLIRQLAGRAGAVAVGTALGQACILLATPFLARRYSPEDFGILALLLTVTNLSVAGACLRFDLALPAADRRETRGLLAAATLGCVGFAGAAGLFAWLVRGQTLPGAALFAAPALVAACILCAGLFQLATTLSLQQSAFRRVALLRVSQGAAFGLLALLPPLGLGWAHVLSFAGGMLVLVWAWGKREPGDASWAEAARRHKDFPLISLPGALLDAGGYGISLWVLIHFFGEAQGGTFSQVQRLTGAPLMLLSMSLAPVLLRQTAELKHEPAILRRFILRLLLSLGVLAAAGLAVVWLCGTPLLRWVLGPQWPLERTFVTLVAVSIFARACVSPLSVVLVTLRRLRIGLAWQGAYFLSAVLVLPFVAARSSFDGFVLFFAAHELVFYGLYLGLILHALRRGPKQEHA